MKAKFKKGDKVINVSDAWFRKGKRAHVLSVPGNKEYDGVAFVDAELGMVLELTGKVAWWAYQKDWKLAPKLVRKTK